MSRTKNYVDCRFALPESMYKQIVKRMGQLHCLSTAEYVRELVRKDLKVGGQLDE